MSLWQRLQSRWKGRKLNTTRTYSLDETLDETVLNLAIQVNRPVNEVQSDVLTFGLNQYLKNVETRALWDSLSPREQDVTALTCLGYSIRLIALKMGVVESIVKSYLESVVIKLKIRSKNDLRNGRIPLERLIVSLIVSRTLGQFRVPSPTAVALSQLEAVGKTLRPGQQVKVLYTLGGPGARVWDLPDSPDPRTVDNPRYEHILNRAVEKILEPIIGPYSSSITSDFKQLPLAI